MGDISRDSRNWNKTQKLRRLREILASDNTNKPAHIKFMPCYHCSKGFALSLIKSCRGGSIIIPTFQMKKQAGKRVSNLSEDMQVIQG